MARGNSHRNQYHTGHPQKRLIHDYFIGMLLFYPFFCWCLKKNQASSTNLGQTYSTWTAGTTWTARHGPSASTRRVLRRAGFSVHSNLDLDVSVPDSEPWKGRWELEPFFFVGRWRNWLEHQRTRYSGMDVVSCCFCILVICFLFALLIMSGFLDENGGRGHGIYSSCGSTTLFCGVYSMERNWICIDRGLIPMSIDPNDGQPVDGKFEKNMLVLQQWIPMDVSLI